MVDELRCEGGEVGDVPLEGVTTRGLGEEEAEGGGFWGFLSRRKVNLPSRELMEDMCGERPKAEREEEGRKRERERTCQRREKGKGRGEGGGVPGGRVESGGEARARKDKADLGIGNTRQRAKRVVVVPVSKESKKKKD